MMSDPSGRFFAALRMTMPEAVINKTVILSAAKNLPTHMGNHRRVLLDTLKHTHVQYNIAAH
jgi:hypothetical protein